MLSPIHAFGATLVLGVGLGAVGAVKGFGLQSFREVGCWRLRFQGRGVQWRRWWWWLPVPTMHEFACGAPCPRRTLQTSFPSTTVVHVFLGEGSRRIQLVRACREETCQQDPLLSGSVRSASAAMLIHASTMVETPSATARVASIPVLKKAHHVANQAQVQALLGKDLFGRDFHEPELLGHHVQF